MKVTHINSVDDFPRQRGVRQQRVVTLEPSDLSVNGFRSI